MLDLLAGFVTELRRSGLPVSLTEHLDCLLYTSDAADE